MRTSQELYRWIEQNSSRVQRPYNQRTITLFAWFTKTYTQHHPKDHKQSMLIHVKSKVPWLPPTSKNAWPYTRRHFVTPKKQKVGILLRFFGGKFLHLTPDTAPVDTSGRGDVTWRIMGPMTWRIRWVCRSHGVYICPMGIGLVGINGLVYLLYYRSIRWWVFLSSKDRVISRQIERWNVNLKSR